jgi:SAM-dependent methyltransferase
VKIPPGTWVTGFCLVHEMSQDHPPICDYEGSDYQQSFWDEANRAYEDRVEAIALRRLLPHGGKRLLELGAGAGRNTTRYQGYEQIVLLDYSRTQLEQALKKLGDGDRYLYVVADVYGLPFKPGSFDGATMIRTLHHLVEPELAMRNIYKTLASGATFILEFANKRNIKAIVRWLLGRQSWNPFDKAQVEFAKLNFNFHPAAIRELVRVVGFEIRQKLTVSHFRIGALKRSVPLGLLVVADSLVQWTGALWQLTPSVFLKMAVPGESTPPIEDQIFMCPRCQGDTLTPRPDGLKCAGCGRLWGFRGGIFDFKEPVREG